MSELVSSVCVRADHQWAAAADAGQLHRTDGGLAWCPDASLDGHERHDWRRVEPCSVAAASGLAAQLIAMESAVS